MVNLRAALVSFAMFVAASSVEAQPTVLFLYEDHPPFTYEENGKPEGVFVPSTMQAISEAGLQAHWRKTTFNRIKRLMSAGQSPFCVTGHSLGDETDGRRYVKPAIGHFGRTGLLVRKNQLAEFEAVQSIQQLFENTELIGGFVAGAIYAIPYQDYVPEDGGRHLFTAGSHEQLAQLVARGRVDFVIENEMMLGVHQQMVTDGAELAFIALPDMPALRSAHIVCSAAVPEALVEKLGDGVQITIKKAASEKAASRMSK